MIKNEMWKMFELTGNIEAYLCYRDCVDDIKIHENESNNYYSVNLSEELFFQGI
ncbi:hypothetical protein CLPU_3c01170 [Gottschalkia purinilytica]|uniref:YqzL-like protein n=1 Tax=Gottschalkia purinilytica TaxID=1503 RepID=A0A0L0WCY0_GOTPU|nr:YqzL family protein [Gottschalkia purinilytica]KNF09339.1 hypothetical protein CLPU_3c01170 [Gottschalkia purinilytica]